jgi:hypothetical protein
LLTFVYDAADELWKKILYPKTAKALNDALAARSRGCVPEPQRVL